MSILTIVAKKLKRQIKRGFWGNLVRSNTGVSSLNFFIIATTMTGMVLLALIPFVIIWDVVHNNTVTSDLGGWASYIGAISTMFASVGLTKAWSNWSENKFGLPGDKKCESESETVTEEETITTEES